MNTLFDIPGMEGLYKIDIYGNVFNKFGKLKKYSIDRYGYKHHGLSNKNKKTYLLLHRIIALIHIPNPDNKPQVNHKNSVRTDNRISNLEWCTNRENILHSFKRPRKVGELKGEDKPTSKLKTFQVLEIRGLIKNGVKIKEIASIYKVSYGCIYDIKSNAKWKHLI